uniref:Diphthine--ammonia ligase n=1 Tax=Archaeoglobus fulgidus TaxID=2234 RepID=A0A7J2TJK5_ARCFL
MILAMWSGGKDSGMALFEAKKRYKVDKLVSMVKGGETRAHRLKEDVLRRQSEALGIELVFGRYSNNFEEVLKSVFIENNAEKVIFGDIYLEHHRNWITRVCKELGIEPIFPLWGRNTRDLAEEVAKKFEAVIIAVRKEYEEILGKRFDRDVIEYLLAKKADPCGENGEFHTVLINGPIFMKRLEVRFGRTFEDEKYKYLEVL